MARRRAARRWGAPRGAAAGPTEDRARPARRSPGAHGAAHAAGGAALTDRDRGRTLPRAARRRRRRAHEVDEGARQAGAGGRLQRGDRIGRRHVEIWRDLHHRDLALGRERVAAVDDPRVRLAEHDLGQHLANVQLARDHLGLERAPRSRPPASPPPSARSARCRRRWGPRARRRRSARRAAGRRRSSARPRGRCERRRPARCRRRAPARRPAPRSRARSCGAGRPTRTRRRRRRARSAREAPGCRPCWSTTCVPA